MTPEAPLANEIVGVEVRVHRRGHRVVEMHRADRQVRRRNRKSDTVDAEAAARSVLAGTSTIMPKSGDGVMVQIRQIKSPETPRKGRTSAIITLKRSF